MKTKLELDPLTGSLVPVTDTVEIEQRLTTLENKHVITTRFASVSASSGTIALPSGSTIRLDDFGGTTDAVVTTIVSGKPSNQFAYTSNGAVVKTTFDSNGAYVLSSAPSAYPVAVVYRVVTDLVDFDGTDSDIVGEIEYLVDPIPAEAHILGLTDEGPIQDDTLSTVIQALGHTIWESGRSGWTEWTGSGNYWSWSAGNPGTFTLLRAGEGYIRGKEVYFSANQTVTIAYNERFYLYIDDDGILQKSATNTLDEKKERINLFIAQNDVNGQFIVINNVHKYDTDIGARQWIDQAHGTVVGFEGSLLTRYGTGTGASETDRQVNISSGTILESDIQELWNLSTTGVTMSHAYLNASGFFARDSYSKSFPMKYSNAGTPTTIDVNSYGIFRVYVTKSDLNTAPPQIITEMNRAQYGNQTQAETVVANNTATNFGRLDGELAQIAQVIVRNTAAGGHVVSITTAKKTVGAVIGSSGVGSTANVIATDTSGFDKVLASTDTTVQAALDKIDEVAQRKDSIGATIVAATEKTTPVDADSVGISDSADGGILKKLTWANLKATLLNTAMTWVGKQTFDGGAAIKGATSAVAAGYVGEMKKETRVGSVKSLTSATWTDGTANPLALTPGWWELSGSMRFATTGAEMTQAIISMATASGTSTTGRVAEEMDIIYSSPVGIDRVITIATPTVYVRVTENTNWYLKVQASGAGTLTITDGHFKARRFA